LLEKYPGRMTMSGRTDSWFSFLYPVTTLIFIEAPSRHSLLLRLPFISTQRKRGRIEWAEFSFVIMFDIKPMEEDMS
jgi:hypothetical protein